MGRLNISDISEEQFEQAHGRPMNDLDRIAHKLDCLQASVEKLMAKIETSETKEKL